MRKNKITFTNELLQDLKTYGATVCVSLATQTREEMFKEAKNAIDAFYDDYEPLYYRRNRYNLKRNSFQKYYKNPHNSVVRGGIELTPYNMDDLYRADTEYVFNLAYLGYHGNVKMLPYEVDNVPPTMSPSPMEILLDKRDYIVGNIDNYVGAATNKANAKNYSTLTT